MEQHLTIAEAHTFTGKSESTIKRLLRDIASRPNHPDRSAILPTLDEVKRKKAAGEPYVWRIDRQLLLRRFPRETSPEEGTESKHQAVGPDPQRDTVVDVLREQLRIKDEQIQAMNRQLDRKDEQIANSNDRLRESNVLMHELQKRLALAAPQTVPSNPIVESVSTSARSPKQPIAPPKKKKPTAAPKRGIFARLFGR